ncbi:Fc.00g027380.m01.CDS01 [Cosmosporella sp. VM-42]
MALNIESLPVELLEPVLSGLSVLEVSRLQQCNKNFSLSLGPYLLSLPSAVSKLMQWSCVHGESWAIKKALSYDADVNVVDVPRKIPNNNQNPAFLKTSTLSLAAKRYQYETFQFLLESGARLDVIGIHCSQTKALRQRLFDSRRPRLLQQCLDYGVKDQIHHYQAGVDETLRPSVKLGLGLDNCRTWLDFGANSTSIAGKKRWGPESALSLAIFSGLVPLAQLLSSQKPDLRAPSMGYHPSRPCNAIPMLAAARYMATHETTELMDMLLEAGGDINLGVNSYMGDFPMSLPHSITPLIAHALSIDFTNDGAGWKLHPSQGVKYLLDRGARIENSVLDIDNAYLHPEPLLVLLWKKKLGGVKCLLNNEV